MNRGFVLVLSTAIISGFSIFINKFGVSVVNPYVFAGLKNLLVAIFLTSLILILKDLPTLKKLTKKQWSLLVGIGLVGGSAPFLLFFKGLTMISAPEGSFIQKTMFVFVSLIAVWALKEKLEKKFIVAALLLLAGNALLLKNLHLTFGVGTLLVLGATVLWAVENVISKYMLRDLSWRIVAWARMFFGSAFIFAFLVFTGQVNLIATIGAKQWGWTLVTAVLLIGYVSTWYAGLKNIEVSKATAILLLGSPITTVLSLIAGGSISVREIGATLLILLGALMVIGLKNILLTLKKVKLSNYART